MEDRRQHERSTVIKGATLFYNNGQSSVPCVVLDQSKTGAKIRISSNELFKCPVTFQLKFQNVDTVHECRQAWVNKNMLGLEYTT